MTDSIYILRETYEKIQTIRESLGKQIEDTRDPDKIYKWRGVAFVNEPIIVKFYDKLPTSVTYCDTFMGAASFVRNNKSDVEYSIGLIEKFDQYLKKHSSFFLEVGHVNDGFVHAHTSKIHGTDSDEYNFTDYHNF